VVDQTHPIVEMMHENQDTLQLDLTNATLVDNRWYKVSQQVTERCLEALESELVNSLPLIDFSNFKVEASRLQGREWGEEVGACTNIERPEVRSRIMSADCHINLIVEATYAFP